MIALRHRMTGVQPRLPYPIAHNLCSSIEAVNLGHLKADMSVKPPRFLSAWGPGDDCSAAALRHPYSSENSRAQLRENPEVYQQCEMRLVEAL
jgi:hypothetical protein